MALIKCPECGKEVSDKSIACPSCGYPIALMRDSKEDKFKEDKLEEKKPEIPQKKNTKNTAIGAIVAVVIIAIACIWFFAVKIPRDKEYALYQGTVTEYNVTVDEYNQKVSGFNDKAKEIISNIKELDTSLDDAQKIIDRGDIPYQADKMTTLSNTIKDIRNNEIMTPELYENAKAIIEDTKIHNTSVDNIKQKIVEVKSSEEKLTAKSQEIVTETASLTIPDFEEQLSIIMTQQKDLEDSYAIQKQVTAPSQEFVIDSLNKVKSVANIAAVTEDNDPNEKLGKAGGYTAQIFFSSPLLGTEALAGDKVIEGGTDAGGSIEVYANLDDVKKRDEYLATFDGTVLDSGAHRIVGTMIVRVSTHLTASKQQKFLDELESALTAAR